ncbi:hypothetical protein ACVIIV_006044 [Bradyrhizobium sp. USDA 4354]
MPRLPPTLKLRRPWTPTPAKPRRSRVAGHDSENSDCRYDGVTKKSTRRKWVYSDSSTMIATNTNTATGGSRMA